ncbi:hypothetical protein KP78_16480 [Jeotgalibacillus soli]|uniref:Uncharacterized protein n=1 Tax=Jeotgalibacillus soli TaxID=889306 RepID=A0A0C2VUU4_9BACL|nr:hypothetical protein KP78_16480 [Jeotgalibacillus soli]
MYRSPCIKENVSGIKLPSYLEKHFAVIHTRNTAIPSYIKEI